MVRPVSNRRRRNPTRLRSVAGSRLTRYWRRPSSAPISRLRINARLLRVGDGALIWSASFDENETDLFKLQNALAVQITESLGASLNAKEMELLTRRDTQNRGAFHAYWRGRFFLEKRNPEKAIAEFQQAINLDPNYALAYTGLADAYIWQASFTNERRR